jgi:hypothetical protein
VRPGARPRLPCHLPSIVTTTFHGAERNKALGVWAALVAPVRQPGVLPGGTHTAGPGWQWVFFINVPVGLAVLFALPFTVPASRSPDGRTDADAPTGHGGRVPDADRHRTAAAAP